MQVFISSAYAYQICITYIKPIINIMGEHAYSLLQFIETIMVFTRSFSIDELTLA